ncbi:MOSC N-terminal beta barrel domain-containing protein [Halostagnicola sp. A-GB9-2]|uniref:MOSC domain-containing protein n=1 Tax=Halostagnicola sp. A-GB9-2 TaxID=3048066 RepID=UPI0024C02C5D|nr:MOSC N-terminal beta barrel domain-containing protein [Halostagnicola sp. A-GB9-2]MDJ1433427.1 MOSC N-terminal beta barrel domain-containing protein [Halostagnicola sp. A-GB9-2]
MAHLEQILVYPVKSLDCTPVEAATIREHGGLEWDRRYAIVDEDGNYVNGKRERQIHGLRAEYDLERETITIWEHATGDSFSFHLEVDRDNFGSWLTCYFGYDVEVVRADEGGFPDDTDASGPTVISTGTLEAVASWFEGIDTTEMRRRLRPNLEISGVEPFWEDRLYDQPGTVVPFEIGSSTINGVNPCQRCVVPTRDPDTGAQTDSFQNRFVERREATLPEWANPAWFDHYFRLMVNTRVPETVWGNRLVTGESITAGEPKPDSAPTTS